MSKKRSYVSPSADILALNIWDFALGSNDLPVDEFYENEHGDPLDI